MIGLYIFAGIIIFFWLLLSLSASVRAAFNSADAENLQIYAKIGFFKINILPAKEKKIKKKRFNLFRRRKVKKVVKKKFKEESRKEKKKEARKYSMGEIIGLSKDMSLILFKKLRKYLKIRIYKIDISVGTEDAYKTAKLYADINQAAYYIYEILKNNAEFKAENINISPDFLNAKVSFDIDIKTGMKIGAGFNIAMAMAVCFIKFRSKSKK